MSWKNHLKNPRILVSIGSLLLAIGIITYEFLGGTPNAPHNFPHAIAGLFMGIALVFLVRGV